MAISIGNKQSKASIGDKEVKTLDVDFDDVVQRVYNIDEDFSYDGEVKQIPIKGKGKLALKVRGGMGNGGRNPGYAEGVLNVKEEDENLFVRVGGNGSGVNGGWNGGGEGNKNDGGGGGGATDIRIKTDSVYARVIVAGGSGGKGPASTGGSGGGPHGGRGNDDANDTGGNNRDAGGGSQTQGGTARNTGGNAGTFGSGGNASGAGATGGGGGGRYGGGGAYDNDADADGKGGGGGSGYVHTAATAVNYPAGCLLNESHYLENAVNAKGGNGTGAGKAAIQGILKRGAEVPTYITQPGVYHNPTLGLISISADGQSWITISDKNAGAGSDDIEDELSYGGYFQFGNIHGFGANSGSIPTAPAECDGIIIGEKATAVK